MVDERQAEAFRRALRKHRPERNEIDLAVQLYGPDSPEAEAATRALAERLAKALSVLDEADVQKLLALVHDATVKGGRH